MRSIHLLISPTSHPCVHGQPRLAHVLLHYRDATLTEQVLHLVAAQSGADPAALRQQMIAALKQQGATFGDPPAGAISEAAIAFLTTPGSLTIEPRPPSPVPLMILRTAAALPAAQLQSLIGLSVSASP